MPRVRRWSPGRGRRSWCRSHREVLELDAAEQRVVVAGAFQFGQPVGPDHAQYDRFEVAVGVAVLRVHREDDQVLEAVGASHGGLEGQQGVEEVGHLEASLGPAPEVLHEGPVVVGVVRKQRGQLLDAVDDTPYGSLGVRTSRRSLCLEVDRPVLGLPWPDPLHGILEHRPCRVLHHPGHGGNVVPRSRLRKNFRHVPSSTGEPLVWRPYTYELPSSKGRLGKLSCATQWSPDFSCRVP